MSFYYSYLGRTGNFTVPGKVTTDGSTEFSGIKRWNIDCAINERVIDAGNSHLLFLMQNGDLYGLGRNGGGNIGTFGTGNNTHFGNPTLINTSSFLGGSTIKSVFCSKHNSKDKGTSGVLLNNNKLYITGELNTYEDSSTEKEVFTHILDSVKHVEILSDATIFYLTTSNVLKCFGINTGSRLGTGNLNPIEKPSQAVTLDLGSSSIRIDTQSIVNKVLLDTGITLYDITDNSNSTNIKSAASGGALTLTLPTSAGTSGQYLKTDGSGNLSWDTVSGGGGGATDSITEGNTTVETVDTGSDGHIKFTTDGTERMRLDNTGSLLVDTIVEKTSATGVTVDGVLLKDSTIRLGSSGDNTIKNSAGNAAITFPNASTEVQLVGNLKLGGNTIKASDGTTAITTSGANVTIAGNLSVGGTNTTVNSTNTTITDALIKLGQGLTESPAKDLGIVFTRGNGSSTNIANKAIIWDESADTFAFIGSNTEDGTTAGNLTINSYEDLQTKSIKLGDGTNMMTLNAASSGGALSLTFPSGNGTSGQYLQTDGSGNLTWSSLSGGGSTDSIADGNTSVETIDTGSDGHIKFTTEGTERMRIISDGNIGIGVNAPTKKLEIFGDILTKGFSTIMGPVLVTQDTTLVATSTGVKRFGYFQY